MNFKKNLKIVRAITMCLALGTMGCINMNMVSASDNLQAPKSAFDKNYKPDMSRGADNFYQSDKVNMQKVEFKNQYNMDAVIVTSNNLNGKSQQDYADDYFDYNGYGVGEDKSGLLLLIDMDDRKVWI